MTTLAQRVKDFADRCLPDFTYTDEDTRQLTFFEIDLKKYIPTEMGTRVGLVMEGEPPREQAPHIFTKWSRSQLLAHFGTREKWFDSVSRVQEASELNERRPTLRGHVLRTMRGYEDDIHILRGLVSSHYADIPDTSIMEALTEVTKNAYVLRDSDKTDRALYAYVVVPEPLAIPGIQGGEVCPGVVVKNSEVGYTSLWVVPTLYFPAYRNILVLEREHVLRRIHRGSVEDLRKDFTEALDKARVVWGTLTEKMKGLQDIVFADEDAAVGAMTNLLVTAKSSKQFSHHCALAYWAANNPFHNGVGVFEAVLTVARRELDADEAYMTSAIAGVVLSGLLG